jgi:hypothetical protein
MYSLQCSHDTLVSQHRARRNESNYYYLLRHSKTPIQTFCIMTLFHVICMLSSSRYSEGGKIFSALFYDAVLA